MKGKFDAYVLWPFAQRIQNWIVDCTEVRFASFFSGGFTTMAVINSPERKFAKRISVDWSTARDYTVDKYKCIVCFLKNWASPSNWQDHLWFRSEIDVVRGDGSKSKHFGLIFIYFLTSNSTILCTFFSSVILFLLYSLLVEVGSRIQFTAFTDKWLTRE